MSSLPLRRIGLILAGIVATGLGIIAQTPVSEARLTPGDTTYFQQFGSALAADGETIVVGAPADNPLGLYNAGAAYVFARAGDAWTEQAKLVAADAADCSQFGYAVAIHGNTILIGAHYDSSSAGAAYVFTREGNTWTQQAKLTPTDATEGKEFGCAVALEGDRLVVGAMADGEGGYTAGAAYVFERAGAVWSQQAKLRSDAAQPGDLFGFAVALAGDTVVVGSPFDDDVGIDAGAVHVFVRTDSGWGLQAELFPSDPATSDVLGWSVAIDGNKVLAGAPLKSGTAEFAGAAYVFSRAGSVWTAEAKLVPADAQANDYFGYALALRGSTAAIGAPLDNSQGDDAGATYLFRCAGTSWNQECELSAKDVQPWDQFGYSVALADSLLAVGAPFNDQTVGWGDYGAAYAFALPTPNGPPVADATATVTEVVSVNRVDAVVTLDGSRSSDPDNDPLSYTWFAGETPIAIGSPATVTLPVGTHELTLTVSDGSLSATANVTITVTPANRPPVADASATVGEVVSVNRVDAVVTLDGSRSSDPDNDALGYTWSAGGAELASGSPASVTLAVGTHELTLTVSDGSLSSTAAVVVRVVLPSNTPPVADASATLAEVISPNNRNAEVILDGSRSRDAEGDVLTFRWSRSGRVVATTPVARVVLPVGKHEMVLSVHDGQAGDQDSAVVRVITPAAATRALMLMVQEADMPAHRERALLATLRVAERSFQRGYMHAAMHQLMVFQRVVQAREGRGIDPATADRLVRAAQHIIDTVPHRQAGGTAAVR